MFESPLTSIFATTVGFTVGICLWAARVERRIALLEQVGEALTSINGKLDDLLQRLSNLEGRIGPY